jgi:hypothetical protein
LSCKTEWSECFGFAAGENTKSATVSDIVCIVVCIMSPGICVEPSQEYPKIAKDPLLAWRLVRNSEEFFVLCMTEWSRATIIGSCAASIGQSRCSEFRDKIVSGVA